MTDVSVYEFLGEQFFFDLANKFYQRVEQDFELKALYPEEDLKPAEERLALFLIQYWGGPDTYSQQRGHPRLRMRHQPYPIDHNMREKWLACMIGALDELAPVNPPYGMMKEYFHQAALAMVNTVSN
jgi:hemoglobin